ncbi:MAG: flagellar biosynthesis protein FlgA, partial [Betaproteobacteria bacterium]
MIHFVVHDEHDSVGVVVVEGVKSGQQLNGWVMDQDKQIKVRAQSNIP